MFAKINVPRWLFDRFVYQATPFLMRLTQLFRSSIIAGCSAGFLNVPRIKGSHYAMKSGMLAAESILEEIWSETPQETAGIEPKSYPDK